MQTVSLSVREALLALEIQSSDQLTARFLGHVTFSAQQPSWDLLRQYDTAVAAIQAAVQRELKEVRYGYRAAMG